MGGSASRVCPIRKVSFNAHGFGRFEASNNLYIYIQIYTDIYRCARVRACVRVRACACVSLTPYVHALNRTVVLGLEVHGIAVEKVTFLKLGHRLRRTAGSDGSYRLLCWRRDAVP